MSPRQEPLTLQTTDYQRFVGTQKFLRPLPDGGCGVAIPCEPTTPKGTSLHWTVGSIRRDVAVRTWTQKFLRPYNSLIINVLCDGAIRRDDDTAEWRLSRCLRGAGGGRSAYAAPEPILKFYH